MDQITDFITKFLPGPGLLPAWQLLVATTAIINALQNFVSDNGSKLVYANAAKRGEVNPLQARDFGVWTLTSGMVRAYAAFSITDPVVYNMALATYVIAAGHFFSELLIFRTCGLTFGAISPIIVASTSIFWMVTARSFYLA